MDLHVFLHAAVDRHAHTNTHGDAHAYKHTSIQTKMEPHCTDIHKHIQTPLTKRHTEMHTPQTHTDTYGDGHTYVDKCVYGDRN